MNSVLVLLLQITAAETEQPVLSKPDQNPPSHPVFIGSACSVRWVTISAMPVPEDFAANASAYKAKLQALDQELRTAIAALPAQQRLLVSCEGAFSYLAADYGLEEAYLWPVNAESEITPKRMARLIDTVREREVPAVFCESTCTWCL